MVAADMHREVIALRADLPPIAGDLSLHIGVNSGHVVARVLGSEVRLDYAVLGDAVILAQRLESAAPPGATYVGETTYQLTRRRFDFGSVGDLTLKGTPRCGPPLLATRSTRGRALRRRREGRPERLHELVEARRLAGASLATCGGVSKSASSSRARRTSR